MIQAIIDNPAARIVSPVAILVLCVVAGIGTVLLLPGQREPAWRKIGGVIVLAAGLILGALVARGMAGRVGPDVYFWIFALIALAGSFRVITHPRPVYSAMYFVLTVFASAGLFVLLWAEFMAAALVLIYAGAILVTYVFVIMLAQQGSGGVGDVGGAEYDRVSREPLLASAIGFALMGVLLFVIFDGAAQIPAPTTEAIEGSAQALGMYLFTHQVVNLELAGVILTLAMVGAIVIARRRVTAGAALERDEVSAQAASADEVGAPATPPNDDPHSIPVYGTDNPAAKQYPER